MMDQPNYCHRYESTEEVLDVIRQRMHLAATQNFHKGGDTSVRDKNTWSGTATLADAVNMAVHGWTEGLADIADGVNAIIVDADRDVPTLATSYDVCGDEADVGRYLAGEPENMIKWESKPHENAVCLEVGMFFSCSTPATTVRNRGAAICAIIDSLESAGRRVELRFTLTVESMQAPTKIHAWTWIAKRAEDPLCMESVAYWLMHTSAFRRAMFAMMEMHHNGLNWNRNAYGRRADFQADPDSVYLPALSDAYETVYATPASSFAHVVGECRAAGIDVTVEG